MNFYTSSYRALEQLASKGELVCKKSGDLQKDLVRFERNLTGANIKESLEAGNTLKVVRLDPANFGDKVVYTGVIPRQDLDLEKVHIVSYEAMIAVGTFLNDNLCKGVYRIKFGETDLVFTKNSEILKRVYGEERAVEVLAYPFDLRFNKFYAPVLVASRFSTGVRNIHIADIEAVQKVSKLSEVLLQDVDVDLSRVYGWFDKNLKNIKDRAALCEKMNISEEDFKKFGDTACVTSSLKLTTEYLWRIMNMFPEEFNVAGYRQKNRRKGYKCEEVPKPRTVQELGDLMQEGFYKVNFVTRSDRPSVLICTNNAEILEEFYGDDYFFRFESKGVCYRKFKDILEGEKTQSASPEYVEYLEKKYGIEGFYEKVKSIGGDKKQYDKAEIFKAIDEMISGLRTRSSSGEGCVLVRNVQCEGNKQQYYKTLDIDTIKSVMRIVG
ncbi:MAG: hypothetical protein LBM93_15555 [Oscillospiraceae bacterium]|nr:hypothetical protein [Oscillospiraceae bacterium]